MLRFFTATFAIAGLVAAAGPIIIHLLNRRRFRVIEWAAMDFLRQAVQRNRRVLQLRDLILLILRVLCVLLFGMALARPFVTNVSDATIWTTFLTGLALVVALTTAIGIIFADTKKSRAISTGVCLVAIAGAALGFYGMMSPSNVDSEQMMNSRQPVHAVLVVDNSMSMGYESLKGTLLDQAKEKAAEFIDRLPAESRVSIIPLCGLETGFSYDAYRNRQDAHDALSRIQVVHRSGSALQAVEAAKQACQQVTDLSAKRVVFLSDQQTNSWSAGSMQKDIDKLPELQIVRIGAENSTNVWISDFRVQDGIADVETPASFLATVQCSGDIPLTGVEVSLTVDDTQVAGQSVDLEPGQARQLEFQHIVDALAEPGKPTYSSAAVSVSVSDSGQDRLPQDNQRYLTVPVVSGIPVVFVDQYGPSEDFEKNRVGESYRLRRLLAPIVSRENAQRELIEVRHTTIERLDQSVLEDARIVVISGIESPYESVPILRQFVDQGGQLIITAGADFDPVAWNEVAWLDGNGILPAPLLPEPVGELPEVATQDIEPFFLDFQSMQHDYFLIPQESREVLEDLFRLPFFFKAVAVDVAESEMDNLIDETAKAIEKQRTELTELQQRLDEAARTNDEDSDNGASDRLEDQRRLEELAPRWLLWGKGPSIADETLEPAELANRSRPRVLARYTTNGLPWLVERRLGHGRVLFFSSGTYSSWNTLTQTNAILVFDRIMRGMLEQSLPRRNYSTGENIVLPAESGDRIKYTLARPGGREETMTLDALGADTYGITIRNALLSGQYTVTSSRDDQADGLQAMKLGQVPVAVNGPAEESELLALDSVALKERMGEANYRWIEQDEEISLEGAQIQARDLWKSCIQMVLVALILEMVILGWPNRRAAEGEAQPEAAS